MSGDIQPVWDTLHLPSQISAIINFMSGNDKWPEASEQALFTLSDAYNTLSKELGDDTQLLSGAANTLLNSWHGPASQQWTNLVQSIVWDSGQQGIPWLQQVAAANAGYTRSFGMQTQYGKIVINILFIMTIIELIVSLILAFISFGTSAAAGLAAAKVTMEAGCRAALKTIVDKVLEKVLLKELRVKVAEVGVKKLGKTLAVDAAKTVFSKAGIAELAATTAQMAAPDIIAQTIQMNETTTGGQQVRQQWDYQSTIQAVESGVINHVIAGPLGSVMHGMGLPKPVIGFVGGTAGALVATKVTTGKWDIGAAVEKGGLPGAMRAHNANIFSPGSVRDAATRLSGRNAATPSGEGTVSETTTDISQSPALRNDPASETTGQTASEVTTAGQTEAGSAARPEATSQTQNLAESQTSNASGSRSAADGQANANAQSGAVGTAETRSANSQTNGEASPTATTRAAETSATRPAETPATTTPARTETPTAHPAETPATTTPHSTEPVTAAARADTPSTTHGETSSRGGDGPSDGGGTRESESSATSDRASSVDPGTRHPADSVSRSNETSSEATPLRSEAPTEGVAPVLHPDAAAVRAETGQRSDVADSRAGSSNRAEGAPRPGDSARESTPRSTEQSRESAPRPTESAPRSAEQTREGTAGERKAGEPANRDAQSPRNAEGKTSEVQNRDETRAGRTPDADKQSRPASETADQASENASGRKAGDPEGSQRQSATAEGDGNKLIAHQSSDEASGAHPDDPGSAANTAHSEDLSAGSGHGPAEPPGDHPGGRDGSGGADRPSDFTRHTARGIVERVRSLIREAGGDPNKIRGETSRPTRSFKSLTRFMEEGLHKGLDPATARDALRATVEQNGENKWQTAAGTRESARRLQDALEPDQRIKIGDRATTESVRNRIRKQLDRLPDEQLPGLAERALPKMLEKHFADNSNYKNAANPIIGKLNQLLHDHTTVREDVGNVMRGLTADDARRTINEFASGSKEVRIARTNEIRALAGEKPVASGRKGPSVTEMTKGIDDLTRSMSETRVKDLAQRLIEHVTPRDVEHLRSQVLTRVNEHIAAAINEALPTHYLPTGARIEFLALPEEASWPTRNVQSAFYEEAATGTPAGIGVRVTPEGFEGRISSLPKFDGIEILNDRQPPVVLLDAKGDYSLTTKMSDRLTTAATRQSKFVLKLLDGEAHVQWPMKSAQDAVFTQRFLRTKGLNIEAVHYDPNAQGGSGGPPHPGPDDGGPRTPADNEPGSGQPHLDPASSRNPDSVATLSEAAAAPPENARSAFADSSPAQPAEHGASAAQRIGDPPPNDPGQHGDPGHASEPKPFEGSVQRGGDSTFQSDQGRARPDRVMDRIQAEMTRPDSAADQGAQSAMARHAGVDGVQDHGDGSYLIRQNDKSDFAVDIAAGDTEAGGFRVPARFDYTSAPGHSADAPPQVRIVISDRLPVEHVGRAIAHAVAESAAHFDGRGDHDVLSPMTEPSRPVAAQDFGIGDTGKAAEYNTLADRLANASPRAEVAILREIANTARLDGLFPENATPAGDIPPWAMRLTGLTDHAQQAVVQSILATHDRTGYVGGSRFLSSMRGAISGTIAAAEVSGVYLLNGLDSASVLKAAVLGPARGIGAAVQGAGLAATKTQTSTRAALSAAIDSGSDSPATRYLDRVSQHPEDAHLGPVDPGQSNPGSLPDGGRGLRGELTDARLYGAGGLTESVADAVAASFIDPSAAADAAAGRSAAALAGSAFTVFSEAHIAHQEGLASRGRESYEDNLATARAAQIRDLVSQVQVKLEAGSGASTYDNALREMTAEMRAKYAVAPDDVSRIRDLAEAASKSHNRRFDLMRSPETRQVRDLRAALSELHMLPGGTDPEPLHRLWALNDGVLVDKISAIVRPPSAVPTHGAFAIKGLIGSGGSTASSLTSYEVTTTHSPEESAAHIGIGAATGPLVGLFDRVASVRDENALATNLPQRLGLSPVEARALDRALDSLAAAHGVGSDGPGSAQADLVRSLSNQTTPNQTVKSGGIRAEQTLKQGAQFLGFAAASEIAGSRVGAEMTVLMAGSGAIVEGFISGRLGQATLNAADFRHGVIDQVQLARFESRQQDGGTPPLRLEPIKPPPDTGDSGIDPAASVATNRLQSIALAAEFVGGSQPPEVHAGIDAAMAQVSRETQAAIARTQLPGTSADSVVANERISAQLDEANDAYARAKSLAADAADHVAQAHGLSHDNPAKAAVLADRAAAETRSLHSVLEIASLHLDHAQQIAHDSNDGSLRALHLRSDQLDNARLNAPFHGDHSPVPPTQPHGEGSYEATRHLAESVLPRSDSTLDQAVIHTRDHAARLGNVAQDNPALGAQARTVERAAAQFEAARSEARSSGRLLDEAAALHESAPLHAADRARQAAEHAARYSEHVIDGNRLLDQARHQSRLEARQSGDRPIIAIDEAARQLIDDVTREQRALQSARRTRDMLEVFSILHHAPAPLPIDPPPPIIPPFPSAPPAGQSPPSGPQSSPAPPPASTPPNVPPILAHPPVNGATPSLAPPVSSQHPSHHPNAGYSPGHSEQTHRPAPPCHLDHHTHEHCHIVTSHVGAHGAETALEAARRALPTGVTLVRTGPHEFDLRINSNVELHLIVNQTSTPGPNALEVRREGTTLYITVNEAASYADVSAEIVSGITAICQQQLGIHPGPATLAPNNPLPQHSSLTLTDYQNIAVLKEIAFELRGACMHDQSALRVILDDQLHKMGMQIDQPDAAARRALLPADFVAALHTTEHGTPIDSLRPDPEFAESSPFWQAIDHVESQPSWAASNSAGH